MRTAARAWFHVKHRWSAIYITALILAVGGTNAWWTLHNLDSSNHQWCALIAAIDPPHAPAPTTARQRVIVRALQDRARSLGCG